MHTPRLHTVQMRMYLQAAVSKPTGGLAAPLAPRHCSQRTKLHLGVQVRFRSSPANDTGANESALPYAELLNIPQPRPSVPRSRLRWTLNVIRSLCMASRARF
jgi:hypothetical protein